MEKEINNLKQLYLETVPPVSDKDGLMDLMQRLGKQKHIPPLYFPRVFIVVGVLFLMASGLVAASFLLPSNPALNSVKAVSQNAYKTIFHPTINVPTTSVENLKAKEITPTTSPTSTQIEKRPNSSKSAEHSGRSIETKKVENNINRKTEVNEKKVENNTINNENNVKGISDSKQKNEEQARNGNTNNSESHSQR